MSDTLDKTLAHLIDQIGGQFHKQNGINKAFFMVINELLQNNISSNMILGHLISQSEGKIPADAMKEIKDISKHLTSDVARHQRMTEAMLDAMQGNSEELEKKLNELFRRKDS